MPQGKPLWLMELGCPAVDKGANQPNVFVDPKSSETALPYFSRGTRDDLMQRRYLRAFIEAFDPGSDGYVAGANPVSSVYGEPMLDLDHVHVYTWDARPYPAFPDRRVGLGRRRQLAARALAQRALGGGPLAETVAQLLEDYGFAAHEGRARRHRAGLRHRSRDGGARCAEPLELAYFFDAWRSGGSIHFRHRGAEPRVRDAARTTISSRAGPATALLTLTRGQETELPASAKIASSTGSRTIRRRWPRRAA